MAKSEAVGSKKSSPPQEPRRVETDPDELSQIEANLTLTPEQRLRQLVRAVRFIEAGRAAVEKLRAARG